jgi:hypothetical protein
VSKLIDWSVTGQILLESLAAGVLIVSAFALGARMVAVGQVHRAAGRRAAAALGAAALCFLVALVAVGVGVWFTVDK